MNSELTSLSQKTEPGHIDVFCFKLLFFNRTFSYPSSQPQKLTTVLGSSIRLLVAVNTSSKHITNRISVIYTYCVMFSIIIYPFSLLKTKDKKSWFSFNKSPNTWLYICHVTIYPLTRVKSRIQSFTYVYFSSANVRSLFSLKNNSNTKLHWNAIDCNLQHSFCQTLTHSWNEASTLYSDNPPLSMGLHSRLDLPSFSYSSIACFVRSSESDTFTSSFLSHSHTHLILPHLHPPTLLFFTSIPHSHSSSTGSLAAADHLPGSRCPGRALSVFIPLLEDK